MTAKIDNRGKAKVLTIMTLIDNLSPAEREFMITVGKVAKEKGNEAAAKLFQ